MTKYTVKTVLNNIIQDKDVQFTYDEKLVSMKWTEEKERKKYTQSGKGPGEFGPDYSDRKKYQLGYGNESPSPILKEFIVNTTRNPRESPYEPHVIEPYDLNRKIKREGTPPLTLQEIEWRHAELKRKQNVSE